MRYEVVWSGRTALECSTYVLDCLDKKSWDNFHFITLHVVDRSSRRIVHAIDVPIDEKRGWPRNMALERIGILSRELEAVILGIQDQLDDGRMSWSDIRV